MKPVLLGLALALVACSGGEGSVPGDTSDTQPFAEIAEDAHLRFTGTEPFWGGEVKGGTLTWYTPENIAGSSIPVARFAGRGGLSFSGELAGQSFDMTITPGECSDAMSDVTYPYVATVQLGEEVLYGCSWDDDMGRPGEQGFDQLGLDDDPRSWGLDALETPED